MENNRKRRRLIVATAFAGGAGVLAGTVPFLSSLSPSARARVTAAPVEVDIGGLVSGQMITVEWQGRPVWILNRTPEMLASLAKTAEHLLDPDSKQKQQPENCANGTRSIHPNLLVVMGVCTHFGCAPLPRLGPEKNESMSAGWMGGFVCSCHGASFDFAGRVFKNTQAPKNLEVPPHRYLSENRLVIGSEEEKT